MTHMDTETGYRYPRDDGNTASECVVTAVADVKHKDPTILSPPLYEAIDPDALDSLMASPNTSRIQFEYADYHITVTSDEIIVTALD